MNESHEELLSIIEQGAVEYYSKYISPDTKNLQKISLDPAESNYFLLKNFFYRGRSDELSYRYEKICLEKLREFFGEDFSKWIRTPNWDNLKTELEKPIRLTKEQFVEKWGKNYFDIFGKPFVIKKEKMGIDVESDRKMVLSFLKFVHKNTEKFDFNAMLWLQNQIEKGKIIETYDFLKEEIFNVGDKLAALGIRETMSLYNMDIETYDDEVAEKLLPIDTQVRKTLGPTGLKWVEKDDDVDQIRRKIIQLCKNKMSPIRFDQGLWYLAKFHPEKIPKLGDNK